MDSSSSSSSTSSSSSSSSSPCDGPKVVIRCGHIIPTIRLTPPDSRPAMAPTPPEQDLGPNSLYVPLRTEEVGWEEGGLIWAPKRYCYPTVNLYGGSDDHVIGTYRGGPKGYRFINITDKAFSVASPEADEDSMKKTKTSKDGRKSSLPYGPATKMQSQGEEADEQTTPKQIEEPERIAATGTATTKTTTIMDEAKAVRDATKDIPSSPSSSTSSTPYSSRRGSSSTTDGHSSGADTGMTTPTSEDICNGVEVEKLEAALSALQKDEDGRESKKTRLASRTGLLTEISNESIDASRLAGPLKTQLQNSSLGLDKSMTLSDSVPSSHFTNARGRATSRRSIPNDSEYSAGWSYEQNMSRDFSQC